MKSKEESSLHLSWEHFMRSDFYIKYLEMIASVKATWNKSTEDVFDIYPKMTVKQAE